ncbi:MAG: Cro/CI family transcriptional regulator [Nitrosomonadaceae bacterium]
MFYSRVIYDGDAMNIDEVITHLGGLKATADALGRSKQSVFHWVKTKKIPLIAQCHIEHVTHGHFKADTSGLPFELVVQ